MITPRFYGFDIETKPRPDLVERFAKPYPDFDEAAIKCGNLGPDKAAAKIAQARLDHEADRASYWANLKDRAALDPFTAEVLCIGVISDTGEPEIFAEKTEEATLRQFWNLVGLSENATSKFVFWAGGGDPYKNFDLDFLVTRSRIRHVPIPSRVRNGRYYSDRFVNLSGEFLLHQREKYLSLSKAADLLDLYVAGGPIWPKRDDDPVTGANFWQWWEGTAHTDVPANEQRAYAVQYLHNDTRHLQLLAPIILT